MNNTATMNYNWRLPRKDMAEKFGQRLGIKSFFVSGKDDCLGLTGENLLSASDRLPTEIQKNIICSWRGKGSCH